MHDAVMRTTLAIDDDVLTAAKGMADREKKTVGEVISALARQALQPQKAKTRARNGVPLLTVRGTTPITAELVNRLRDEAP